MGLSDEAWTLWILDPEGTIREAITPSSQVQRSDSSLEIYSQSSEIHHALNEDLTHEFKSGTHWNPYFGRTKIAYQPHLPLE